MASLPLQGIVTWQPSRRVAGALERPKCWVRATQAIARMFMLLGLGRRKLCLDGPGDTAANHPGVSGGARQNIELNSSNSNPLLLMRASRLQQSLDDEPARVAKLFRQLAQAERRLSEPETIELHQLRLVDRKRNPGPQRVEIVGCKIGRHGDRHNGVDRQIENACD